MAVRTEYKYEVAIDDVYDGDTFKGQIFIDLGFRKYYEEYMAFRLFGVDTPEVRTNKKIFPLRLRAKHKLAGIYVREFVRSLILDKKLVITTHKAPDKYGRTLADVFVTYYGKPSVSLSSILVGYGYGKEYYGGNKYPFSEKELDAIIDNLGSIK